MLKQTLVAEPGEHWRSGSDIFEHILEGIEGQASVGFVSLEESLNLFTLEVE
eukprot:CAMPEP_0170482582 /NCGR_PEP_ID=MMETSP0208-20121228/2536_1 /TAXON_ID=197538 /ORGANISM="Strombidium inclinatum, Strain S3" /LENGTH=51 /DNA_ID=CAMNT_0010755433 /DNA_START=217 /DNA_END=372 /DNA_ORIENTATION=+